MADAPDDAVDRFMEDLSDRDARHRRESAAAFATVRQLGEVKTEIADVKFDLKELRTDVHRVTETLEGSVHGTKRIPGLIDIVSIQGATMQSIKRVLYAIFVVLALDFAIGILQHFGFLVGIRG